VSKRNPVEIRTSPHLKRNLSVDQIMLQVVYALLPVTLFSIYQFGISAAAVLLTSVLAAMGSEWLFCRLSNRPSTLNDNSALLTGLLLGLTLPPGFPLWMVVVAAVAGIGIGKVFFGGLGQNILNPALVGRAFVQAAFPVAITTWTPNLLPGRFLELIPSTLSWPLLLPHPVAEWISSKSVDGFSGATPLALQKFEQTTTATFDLFSGATTGSLGETSFLLILLGGLYLAARNFLDWRIPAGIFASAALVALITQWSDPSHAGPLFHLLSGGMALGAIFMATDMVGSPVTPAGVWLYAILIGALTVIIRVYGGLTEGVMYAILLGNILTPLIERVTQPRSYGAVK
jgi:electron transport complex protein RnfD